MKIPFHIIETGLVEYRSKVFYHYDSYGIITRPGVMDNGVSIIIDTLGINIDHNDCLGDISGYCPKGMWNIGKVDFPEDYSYGKLFIPEDFQKELEDGDVFDGIEHKFIYDENTNILRIGNVFDNCRNIKCMPETIVAVDEFGYVKTLRIHITEVDDFL